MLEFYKLLELFKSGNEVIDVSDRLFDPKGFNLTAVPGRSYKVFKPVFTAEKTELQSFFDLDTDVIYQHLMAARLAMFDIIGEEYLFIRAYRVGRTDNKGETVIAVIESQLRGGATCINDDDGIGGDRTGQWFIVLCPEGSESELIADIKSDEARRRESLPRMQYIEVDPSEREVDTSELP